jgi:Sec-independent protein translocase protein TatA
VKIFNLGLLEIVFIVLLAFIVLGPEKAVEEAGNLGRWVRKIIKSPFWRDLVSTSRDIQDIPRKIMDDAEIQKTLE